MSRSRRGGVRPRRVEHEEHEEHENHERWLVSYADMMTLLMVLFIVMFAMSQIDKNKFAALRTSLAAGFGARVSLLNDGGGVLEQGNSMAAENIELVGPAGVPLKANGEESAELVNPKAVAELVKATERSRVAEEVAALERARKELKAALERAKLRTGATFRFDERGLVVTIATDDVLFASGSADLRLEGRRILAALRPTLRKLPNRLSVDGHTNSLPIRTARFPSNWELSTYRATGVLRYLAAGPKGVPGTRMSAAGFADTRPIVPPRDPRGIVANRRVEIVVLARIDDPAGRAVAELGQEAGELRG